MFDSKGFIFYFKKLIDATGMSWKRDYIVNVVVKLPTCGTFLNLPIQLDFLEGLLDNQDDYKNYVQVCEQQFNQGNPTYTENELKMPTEHNYSKNPSDRDSDLEGFDRKIKELSQPSSDEDTISLSGDERTSGEGPSAEGLVFKQKLTSTPVHPSASSTATSMPPRHLTSRTSGSRVDIGKRSRSRSPRMRSATADREGRGSSRDSHVKNKTYTPEKSEIKFRGRRTNSAVVKKINHQRSPESSSASGNVPSTGEESSQSSSSDLPQPKHRELKNASLKSLLKQSRAAVNSSYGSYTTQGTLAVGKPNVKCQQVEFYCLRKLESPIRIPDDKEEVRLTTSGLGSKMIQVPLEHSSKDMKKLILQNFPSIKGDFIIACRLKRKDKILEPVFKVVPSMAQLLQKAPTKNSTMYVVPYDDINVADREKKVPCSKCNSLIKVSKRFEHHITCDGGPSNN